MLAVIKGLSGPKIERLEENVVKIIKDCEINIKIEANLHTVNCVNVTFDLRKDSIYPTESQIIHQFT